MSGWVIGWAIGAVVVAAVAGLLVLMIVGAGRAGAKAEEIAAALDDARRGTDGLWKLTETNRTAARIVDGAGAAREALAGGSDAR
jgi:hypothetical protein